jgi:nucleotide-binding universal stress UspA family protein
MRSRRRRMKKILIAVDDTKGTRKMFDNVLHYCKCINPEEIIILYVEKFEGLSLMDEMLGDAEMSELKKAMEGTTLKEAMDRKAKMILDYYKKKLQENPPTLAVRTVLRSGHPAEEILKTAEDEKPDLIMIGSRGKRLGRFFIGSVSREVVNNSSVSVLLVK